MHGYSKTIKRAVYQLEKKNVDTVTKDDSCFGTFLLNWNKKVGSNNNLRVGRKRVTVGVSGDRCGAHRRRFASKDAW